VTFGRQWIAPSFAAFLAQHPHIRIDAHFTDRIVDVIADGFDGPVIFLVTWRDSILAWIRSA